MSSVGSLPLLSISLLLPEIPVNLRRLLPFPLLLLCVAAADCVAQGGSGLQFDSSYVLFGPIAKGTCQDRQVTLRNPRDTPPLDSAYRIRFIRFVGQDRSVTILPVQDSLLVDSESIVLTLRWCPPDNGDTNSSYLADSLEVLYTTLIDSANNLSVIIPVNGMATPPAPINALSTVDSLVFGSVHLLECDSGSFTINNDGTTTRSLEFAIRGPSANQFSIISPQGGQLRQLLPHDSTVVIVSYCPDGLKTDDAFISVEDVNDSNRQVDVITLSGIGSSPWNLATRIDLNPVDSGVCIDTVIRFQPQTAQQFVVGNVQHLEPDGPAFNLTFLPSSGVPNELHIHFCPNKVGSLTDSIVVYDSITGRPFAWLRISGVGKAPADTVTPRSVVLSLDTADVRVGDPIRLVLHAQPSLRPDDFSDSLRFTLTLPKRALFFNGVESIAEGWSVSGKRLDDTTVAIGLRADARAAAPTTTPLAILLTGLTTGSRVNTVSLQLDSNFQAPVTFLTLDGRVLLDGCELGSDPRLSRRVAIKGLHLDPHDGTTLLVNYSAPLHAPVQLRLADVSGTSVQTFELPEGTDTDAITTLQLERIAPGLCVVELRAGDSRSTTLMMIGP